MRDYGIRSDQSVKERHVAIDTWLAANGFTAEEGAAAHWAIEQGRSRYAEELLMDLELGSGPLERARRQGAAQAVKEIADDWQWRAWGDTPRRADIVEDRMSAAQYVTDYLRGHARRLQERVDG